MAYPTPSAAQIRARAELARAEIAWRATVTTQRRDDRRAEARARRDRQRAERVAAGTDRATLRALRAARRA